MMEKFLFAASVAGLSMVDLDALAAAGAVKLHFTFTPSAEDGHAVREALHSIDRLRELSRGNLDGSEADVSPSLSDQLEAALTRVEAMENGKQDTVAILTAVESRGLAFRVARGARSCEQLGSVRLEVHRGRDTVPTPPPASMNALG